MSYRVPKWLRRYARHAQDKLGLQVWAVGLEITDQPNPDNPDADATCCSNVHYLTASLRFRPQYMQADTPSGRVLVLHELLHLVDAHQDRVVDHLVDELVPADARSLAANLVNDQREQRVTRLSRMLLDLVGDPPQRKKGRDGKVS